MSNVTSSANPDQEVAAAVEASQQCGNEQCTCATPCRCLPYEIHLKVVTRLGGIPVKGISCLQEAKLSDAGRVLESGIYFGRSDEDGNFSKLRLTRKKLELALTYANEAEKLRTETISVTIDNLTPTCTEKSGLKAQFKHQIEKIRNVLGDPTEEEIQTAMENNTASNMDSHFIDEYSIDVTALEEEAEDTNTSPVPPADFENIDSKLSIVPAADGEVMQVYLNVSLATFSLKVPYMSQVVSHVMLTNEDVSKYNPEIGVRAWAPTHVRDKTPLEELAETAIGVADKTVTGKLTMMAVDTATKEVNGVVEQVTPPIKETVGRERDLSPELDYDLNKPPNPWHGERLCSPTSSAMIMQYYRLANVDNIQTRADIMAAYFNRTGSTAYSKDRWENWENIPLTWTYIVGQCFPEQTVANFNANHGETPGKVSDPLKKFMQYLSYGHPLQVRIKGGHMAVLIGVVLNHESKKLWAICHDPYGTLVGPTSDYSRLTTASFYEHPLGKKSRSRRERNAETDADGIREKGRHVYYNDETHTRGDKFYGDSEKGSHLQIGRYVYMTYRHPDDVNMLTKVFVTKNLVQGDE